MKGNKYPCTGATLRNIFIFGASRGLLLKKQILSFQGRPYFRKDLGYREANKESKTLSPFTKIVENLLSMSIPIHKKKNGFRWWVCKIYEQVDPFHYFIICM